jgi:hypothetical protein
VTLPYNRIVATPHYSNPTFLSPLSMGSSIWVFFFIPTLTFFLSPWFFVCLQKFLAFPFDFGCGFCLHVWYYLKYKCVTPLLWPSLGVKPNTWKSWELESSGTPECLELNSKRKNTSHWGVLGFIESSWNVDIENVLALAIRTFAAQVMGKRRAGSQTGSLTPDH